MTSPFEPLSARPPRPGECPAKCQVPCKSWLHCATRHHQHNLCTCGMRQTTCICGKPKNVTPSTS